jgi:AAA family ATP:ADP antiporter
LFANFFLILTALYQLKPASRSMVIEAMGAQRLPYVWIVTAVTMIVFVSWYHRLVARYPRINIVMGSCLTICGLLVLFRGLLTLPGPTAALGFYVFVDIMGVVLVEQFWSLTNALYTTGEGKSWYGFVGAGGLFGGVAGGGLSALLVRHTPLETPDLLLTAAITILIVLLLTRTMGRFGIYRETAPGTQPIPVGQGGLRRLGRSRYLLLMAGVLLLVQLVSPLIEYQFLNTVEASFPDQETRTAYLSLFFSVMGLIAIAVNLGITPVVHQVFGTIPGLLVQPVMITLCSCFFLLDPSLIMGAAAKISDRALSHSINRASKELLYVPIPPVLIYQAKAWLDMLGYRLFKVSGSLIILTVTQWLPVAMDLSQLSWIAITICGLWIFLVTVLGQEYRMVCKNQGGFLTSPPEFPFHNF